MLQPPCTIKMNFPTGYPGLTLRYLYAIEQNSFLDNNYTFNSWLIGNFKSFTETTDLKFSFWTLKRV